MARRRRRRKGEDGEEADGLGGEEVEEEDPSPEAQARRDLASLCLTHPTRPVTHTCDLCTEPLCAMCSLELRGQSLCPHCFEKSFRDGRLRRVGWQGWAGTAAALASIGAVLAPFTLADRLGWMDGLPGGRVLLVFAATALGIAAVWLGFSAQDFGGPGGRAGWVAVVFGVLALLAVIGLNLLAVIGV